MIWLLDVNVLIALGDADHPQRVPALRFFEQQAVPDGWATCPLTENAFLRILGQPAYVRPAGSPDEVRHLLQRLLAAPGHQFWPDDLSLADARVFPRLPPARHLTDLYLLALAAKRGGRLATFDQSLDPSLLPGGPATCHVLPMS